MGNLLDTIFNPPLPQRQYSSPTFAYSHDSNQSNPIRNVPSVHPVRLPPRPATRIHYRESGNIPQRTQSTLYQRVLQNSCWPPISTEFNYQLLDNVSYEYQKIQKLFHKTTNKSNHVIRQIVRVQNPYLKGQFLIRKLELKNRHDFIESRLLFHGTNASNIANICRENFDWRKFGIGTGHKFGHGVSFSPKAYYSSHYSDKQSHDKVMIVAEVLIGKCCEGTNGMKLPDFCVSNVTRKPVRCDTSIKPSGDVIVKYADDEFYPAYLIYFHAKRLNLNRNSNHSAN